FTVIHKVPGMVNRDDALAGKNLTDYAVVAMIGIGGIRESHNIGGFFATDRKDGPEWEPVPGAEPAVWMNVKRLDELFTQADAEARKYGLTWFFQANSRPKYATPAVYEAMAAALVGRYKDRCRTWEVENEPNFGYTPEKYVAECVIPFAKGAKRADPGCAILGPGGCGVRDTLRFMEAIYAAGQGKWFDQISTHTYPGPGEAWGRFGNLAMLGQLRAWMKEHGDAAKPLWQTEQGYNWELNPKGQAARYAARQFLQGWRMGIEPSRQYYFYPQAHGFESWYQSGGGEAGSEHSWLPVAAAHRFVAENTLGRTYAGDVPAPYKGVYLPRFTGEAGDVVAAWTFDFAMDLKVRAKGLRQVVGYMGNPLDIKAAADGTLVLPLSGDPLYVHLEKGGALEVLTPAFGPNLAAKDAGGAAAASSADAKHPAALANDGNWELWEDAPGLPGRTSWISDRMDPTPKEPDWLEVTFPAPRKVSRLVMLGYLPAVNPSPRDFEFQVREGGRWRTVASGKDEGTWVLYREFPPAMATAVRMVVTRINDGWQGDRRWMHVLMGPDAKNYTASKLMVAELEAYGPEQAATAGVE
ncbi:MAG: discoidin domain-containing protein, partial [Planctomycetes bacterium]|nr:discoidin domain-containing protein [Planctomycetota bacterium]